MLIKPLSPEVNQLECEDDHSTKNLTYVELQLHILYMSPQHNAETQMHLYLLLMFAPILTFQNMQ
jgi:hypothetical protein